METWDDRAKAVIGQGCNTYSKRSDQFIKGVYPTHSFGYNYYGDMMGADGKEYVDFISALGANYIHSDSSCSIPYTKEVELAKTLVDMVQCVEKLKMVKTGSAACEAAVRIGRAWLEKRGTTNPLTIGSGYHGCHNIFIAAENPGFGTACEGYSKQESVHSVIHALKDHSEPSVVIVEPIHLSANDDDRLLLEGLRMACDETGSVLIFDETITFGRVPEWTVSNWWEVQPDLIVFGKALGNGQPINIVGGRAELMDNPGYFISNTHNGELTAIESALNVLRTIDASDIKKLWLRAAYMRDRFNKICGNIKLIGYPTRLTWDGDWPAIYVFWQEMCKKGYLLGKAFFVRHGQSVELMDRFLEDSTNCIKDIKKYNIQLEGEEPQPIFKRY